MTANAHKIPREAFKTHMNFIKVNYKDPHRERTRILLKNHPEVKELFGPTLISLPIGALIVTLHTLIAWHVRDQSIWLSLILALCLGAFFQHTLFVLIHECAHDLVFKKKIHNRLFSIFINLVGFVPSAIAFREYHLLHHRFQGDLNWDADLPGTKEAKTVGNSWWKKALWLANFSIIEGVFRPIRLNKVPLFTSWGIFNLFTTLGFNILIVYFGGWNSLLYLAVSLYFSIGLHPLGGRWIQEHFVFHPNQETYSYYGPLNILSLNVGYHNEHHDLMYVPWINLPKIKKAAPEIYDSLRSHSSLTALVWKFIFDPKLSLYNRVIRDGGPASGTKTTATVDKENLTELGPLQFQDTQSS